LLSDVEDNLSRGGVMTESPRGIVSGGSETVDSDTVAAGRPAQDVGQEDLTRVSVTPERNAHEQGAQENGTPERDTSERDMSAREPYGRGMALFYAPNGRMRAGWRLLFFLAIAYACAFALYAMVPWGIAAAPWIDTRLVLYPLILPLSLLVAHAIMLYGVEQRDWRFVAMGRDALAPSPVLFGLTFGALAIAVPTAILLLSRFFVIQPAPDGNWIAATVRSTAFLIPAALWEELLFRGYPFAVLRESVGWKGALLVTSFVFGLAHMQNGGADMQNILIVVIAGFFLGMVLLATRSFYAAWTAHFAWNWVMACGFHVSVSGNPFERPDYELVSHGPTWLTGGVWGPEGGVGAAVGLFVAVFYVYGRYLKRLER
jgi:membrane protease YdiL (CAAX protease family)